MEKKRVVVFGIFDGIHEGHRSFFQQAKRKGTELIVIVGRDSASIRLKNKKPRYPEQTRLSLVLKEEYVDGAVLGDEEQSVYHVLEELDPDMVCLGYDQEKLGMDLEQWIRKKGKNILLHFCKKYQRNVQ